MNSPITITLESSINGFKDATPTRTHIDKKAKYYAALNNIKSHEMFQFGPVELKLLKYFRRVRWNHRKAKMNSKRIHHHDSNGVEDCYLEKDNSIVLIVDRPCRKNRLMTSVFDSPSQDLANEMDKKVQKYVEYTKKHGGNSNV